MPAPITVDDWEARLRAHPPVNLTDAELRGCARLMAAYTEGAEWLRRRVGPERAAPIAGFVPSIVVAMPDAGYAPIATRNDGTDILILGDHLRWWARRPPNRPVTLTSSRGDTLMTATPIDFFRLAGVEETQHLLSIREGTALPERQGRPVRDTFEYHAKDIEFAAMEPKIAFAEEHGLPPQLRLRLRAIQAGARRVRAARGLDRQAAPVDGLALG
jgi:hypothetical protein